jgi:hypothetical protein
MHIAVLSAAVLLVTQLPADSPRWSSTPPVPLPAGVTSSVLTDVTVVAPDDVWAVGTGWGGGEDQPLAEHWDGAAWTGVAVPSGPATTYLNAVDAAGALWAVGSAESATATTPLILRYSGGTWAAEPTPGSPGVLNDIDMQTDGAGWAVGRTTTGTGGTRPLVLQRRTGQWAPVAVPISALPQELTSVFAASPTDVWIAGRETAVGGRQLPLILHWDGRTWTRAILPADTGHDQDRLSIAATSGKDVWAAGSSCASVVPATCTPLVLHLTGAWQTVPASGAAILTEVVPFSPTDVWVVGENAPAATNPNHVEHWDGRQFTVDITTPAPRTTNSKPVSALALAAAAGDPASGALWAVGWQGTFPRMSQAIHR